MSDKNEVSTSEHVAPAGGKKGALKRHCARFWWLHLIIFVLVAVFVILITVARVWGATRDSGLQHKLKFPQGSSPTREQTYTLGHARNSNLQKYAPRESPANTPRPSIFVAIPRIAQDKINQAKLEIVAVKISNATPDSYQMTINSTISTDGTVKADIDPFAGDMYLEDTPDQTPFAVLNFPPTNANKHSNVNVDQLVKITNMDAFNKFNTWFVNNETLKIGIKGKTKVQPKGLSKKYDVTFHKVQEIKGLNLFKGMKVENAKVDLKTNSKNSTDFRNFNATAVLPNPSHFSLDIGNATFDNYFLGANLGKLYIDNLSLVPGENKAFVTGALDQGQIILLMGANKPYCETGVAQFSLIGSNVTRNGEEIPYFQYALAHANQTVELDVGETLKNSNFPAKITCV
ncbi:hypothetical protein NLG97_g6952 [Lecanicillium saksenae]|uniref:Uncharacterized protein n=1 Tax=Lecanicillium saksenae TaxID=468837 RepID=A0ACC1QQI4_9HYPO|nr:hypothetical protein NLG97_g6952 [Lecanicillium saksenae]